MRDPRLKALAKQILLHSVRAEKGNKVMIHGHHNTKPLMLELVEEAYELGAYPFIEVRDDDLDRQWALQSSREQYETMAKWDLQRFKDIDAVIFIVGEENDAEMTDIPAEVFRVNGEVMKPVADYYINNCRWVLLNYPTKSLAQKAGMSTRKFEDFLLDVCTVDYVKMAKAMAPLKELMDKTDRVRIVSPGTDLTFSIKGIPAVMCYGERNIPDGEVYTAPVKDSVNGTITYNTPCPYQGTTFRNVSLTFKDGKIIDAQADQTEKINQILDIDEGARYIGEFALGLNPMIHHPMGDILFDEKIHGSLHFTPGIAYKEADNGNVSAVHWDMVLVQREEYGGGEIYFDDRLIRKDGLFVLPELEGLNPNSLLGE
ncbi:aminopeptidase [Pradoshia sp.]